MGHTNPRDGPPVGEKGRCGGNRRKQADGSGERRVRGGGAGGTDQPDRRLCCHADAETQQYSCSTSGGVCTASVSGRLDGGNNSGESSGQLTPTCILAYWPQRPLDSGQTTSKDKKSRRQACLCCLRWLRIKVDSEKKNMCKRNNNRTIQ